MVEARVTGGVQISTDEGRMVGAITMRPEDTISIALRIAEKEGADILPHHLIAWCHFKETTFIPLTYERIAVR